MSLVESRSHIIHAMIPSEKMTAKNDLQTEYIYNSVGVIEALAAARSNLKRTKTARNLPPNTEQKS